MKHHVACFLALLAIAVAGGSTSAHADEASYDIQKSAPRATVGVETKVSLTVQGKNGWHVNEEAPITVTVKADPSVTLPKPKLARADLAQSSKQTARFDIPFSASTPGKKTITAEARFVMCQEQACKPAKETVVMDVDVAGASPPAPGKHEKSVKAKSPTP